MSTETTDAGPIPDQTPPKDEVQSEIFAAEAVSRLKGPRDSLTSDDALDLLIRLEAQSPIDRPLVGENEYMHGGQLRELFGWLCRHCKELGTGTTKLATLWHWHGRKGSWTSRGRTVQARIEAFRPSAVEVASHAGALVVNARWWGIASPTQRIRALWRAVADSQKNPVEIQPAELRLFGLVDRDAVNVRNALQEDPMVAASIQMSILDDPAFEESELDPDPDEEFDEDEEEWEDDEGEDVGQPEGPPSDADEDALEAETESMDARSLARTMDPKTVNAEFDAAQALMDSPSPTEKLFNQVGDEIAGDTEVAGPEPV